MCGWDSLTFMWYFYLRVGQSYIHLVFLSAGGTVLHPSGISICGWDSLISIWCFDLQVRLSSIHLVSVSARWAVLYTRLLFFIAGGIVSHIHLLFLFECDVRTQGGCRLSCMDRGGCRCRHRHGLCLGSTCVPTWAPCMHVHKTGQRPPHTDSPKQTSVSKSGS